MTTPLGESWWELVHVRAPNKTTNSFFFTLFVLMQNKSDTARAIDKLTTTGHQIVVHTPELELFLYVMSLCLYVASHSPADIWLGLGWPWPHPQAAVWLMVCHCWRQRRRVLTSSRRHSYGAPRDGACSLGHNLHPAKPDGNSVVHEFTTHKLTYKQNESKLDKSWG